MNIDVKVKLNKGVVNRLEKAAEQAFEMTVEAVLSDIKTSAVVPKETGMLQDGGFSPDGKEQRSGYIEIDVKDMVAKIIFDTPYARRLYWNPEYNFRTDKNINAQGKWMQDYIDGLKKDFVKDTYIDFLKQLSGGLIK